MRWFAVFCLVAVMLSAAPVTAQSVSDQGPAAVAWLNAFRASKGQGPVSVSPALTKAAAAHVRDMAQNGFFSHSGSDGSDIAQRIRRQGYGFCFAAENIAKGQRDLTQVLNGWAKSKGHRRNMLAKDAQEFGLVLGPDRLWVMVLGRPGC